MSGFCWRRPCVSNGEVANIHAVNLAKKGGGCFKLTFDSETRIDFIMQAQINKKKEEEK